MKYRLAIALALVLAAAAIAGWLGWRFLAASPEMQTGPIVAASSGHAYQYIAAPGLDWNTARAAAATLSWHGHRGYLATVDDAAEYQFIMDRVFAHGYPDVTYLGGRQTARGEWRWVTGPDGAAEDGKGLLFWTGDEQGAVQPGRYANWMSTAFQHGGKWDLSKVCCVVLFSYGVPQFSTSLGTGDAEEHIAGYLVEFSS